jgi:hypothetical protein
MNWNARPDRAKNPIKTLALTLICLSGLVLGAGECRAQNSSANDSSAGSSAQDSVVSEQQIDLMRKDLRTKKKQVIAANMQLTGAQAERFWPLYDEYTAETIQINDKKYGLIKTYADNYGHMTDQQAEDYVRGMVEVDESASELRTKYWPKFRQVISARNTALFFQMDRRIAQMIDLQVSSQIPLIEP